MKLLIFVFLFLSKLAFADTYNAIGTYSFGANNYTISGFNSINSACANAPAAWSQYTGYPSSAVYLNGYSIVGNNTWNCILYNSRTNAFQTNEGAAVAYFSCPYGGTLSGYYSSSNTTQPPVCLNTPACPSGQSRDASGACVIPGVTISKVIGSCSSCSGNNSSMHYGNPIHAGIGNKYQVETDYVGVGEFPLTFERYYNSNPSTNSYAFTGYTRWRHNYEYSLTITSNQITAYRPDGKSYVFNLLNGVWVADSDVNLKLVGNSNGYSLTTDSDIVESYDANGKIISLKNRAGITHTLAYNSLGQLASITHSNGRSLTFSFDSLYRLLAFYDPNGKLYLYTYSTSDPTQDLTQVKYPDQSYKTYVYNESSYVGTSFPHALTGIVDEKGNRFATFKYDAYYRGISTEHAGGAEKVSISYGNGNSTITDALNTASTTNYQIVNGVIKNSGVTQAAGAGSAASTNSRTFDANGNVTGITDFNGNLSCYAYDTTRNLETARIEGLAPGSVCPSNLASYTLPTGSSARKVLTQWHSTYRLPVQIVEANQTSSFNYDANGNLLQKTITDTNTQQSRVWTYTYNTLGQVLTADGPRTDVNDVTTYTYYTDSTTTHKPGDLWTATNAKGHVTTFNSYDAHGHVTQMTDPNGLVTTFTYDLRNRLKTKTVNGATTTYGYDLAGNLTSVTKPTGVSFTFTYDAAHRLTDIIDAQGGKIHYTLDLIGNRTKEQILNAAGTVVKTKSRSYDALSRLAQEIGAYNQTKSFQYDANGNLKLITDANGHSLQKSYDTLNRLIQDTDALNGQTDYQYDSLGHLIQVLDANNLATTYQYNAFGDVLALNSPNTGLTQYGYDNAGNLVQKTDASNTTGTYAYDVLNRLTSVTYPNGDANVTRVYDTGTNQKGRLTSASRGTVTTTYGYDLLGNVTSTSANSLPWGGNAIGYSYNADNQVVDIAYGASRDVQYQYDTTGQVSQVSVHDVDKGAHSTNGYNVTRTLASNITHLPFGPVKSLTYGNGLALNRAYDNDYRLAGQTVGTNQSLGYSYDAGGNLSALTDGINASNSASYTYDPVDRLLSSTGTQNAFTYTYDLDGNRTIDSKNGAQTQYSYDLNSQRLLAQTGANPDTLVTDANGNVTLSKGKTLNYASDQRVANIQQGSNTIATYQYDSFGQRTAKVLSTNTQAFDYDLNGHLIHENAAPGNYVYLDGEPLARVDYNLSDTSGNVNSWNVAYYHNNQVRAPLQTTDSNGNITWTGQWDAYGNVLPINPNITQNVRFPGQYYDAESGLLYNMQRYYRDGRYLQSDRIGLMGGVNTYAYVLNNPLRWVDRLGFKPGDVFENPQDASIDALNWILKNKNNTNEWAGTIYQQLNDGKFVATDPAEGGAAWSSPSKPSWNQGDVRAYYHTHAKCTKKDIEDDYSRPGIDPKTGEFVVDSDTHLSWSSQLPSYLGTPGGYVLMFSPNPPSGVENEGVITTLQKGSCCPGENFLK